jgi:hypothetical protein
VSENLDRLLLAQDLARAWTLRAESLDGVHRRAAMRQARYLALANEAADLAIEAARDVASDHNR